MLHHSELVFFNNFYPKIPKTPQKPYHVIVLFNKYFLLFPSDIKKVRGTLMNDEQIITMLETLRKYKECEITHRIQNYLIKFNEKSNRFEITNLENDCTKSYEEISEISNVINRMIQNI